MSCPTCGESLEMDPDGGYCDIDGYWDIKDLEAHWEEDDNRLEYPEE